MALLSDEIAAELARSSPRSRTPSGSRSFSQALADPGVGSRCDGSSRSWRRSTRSSAPSPATSSSTRSACGELGIARTPAIAVLGASKDYGVRFYGAPAGYEFGSLIDAILDVSSGESGLAEETRTALATPRAGRAHPGLLDADLTVLPPGGPPGHPVRDRERRDHARTRRGHGLSRTWRAPTASRGVPKTVVGDDGVEFVGAGPEAMLLEHVRKPRAGPAASSSPEPRAVSRRGSQTLRTGREPESMLLEARSGGGRGERARRLASPARREPSPRFAASRSSIHSGVASRCGGGTQHPPHERAVYIDAFRGLMALVMVQGHVMDTLLAPAGLRPAALRLAADGPRLDGAGLPVRLGLRGRAAAALRCRCGPRLRRGAAAAVRARRRLLASTCPTSRSGRRSARSTSAERAALFACDALQVIAVTQLFVLRCRSLVGRRWTVSAGVLALAVVAADTLRVGLRLVARGCPSRSRPGSTSRPARTSRSSPSRPSCSRARSRARGSAAPRRPCATGASSAGGWACCSSVRRSPPLLRGKVDFWGASPAYVLRAARRAAAAAAPRRGRGGDRAGLGARSSRSSATRRCSSTCCTSTCSSAASSARRRSPLRTARSASPAPTLVLLAMLPVLLGAAWLWRTAKQRAPHEARLLLLFLTRRVPLRVRVRPW